MPDRVGAFAKSTGVWGGYVDTLRMLSGAGAFEAGPLVGVGIYGLAGTLLAYLALGSQPPPPIVWNAIYWVLLSTGAVLNATRALGAEFDRLRLYYYGLARPTTLYAALLTLSVLTQSGMAMLLYGAMSLFLGHPHEQSGLFVLYGLIGSAALSAAVLMGAMLGSGTRAPGLYIPMISLPLSLSPAAYGLRLTRRASDGLIEPGIWPALTEGWPLLALTGLVMAAGILLFPYVWRD